MSNQEPAFVISPPPEIFDIFAFFDISAAERGAVALLTDPPPAESA